MSRIRQRASNVTIGIKGLIILTVCFVVLIVLMAAYFLVPQVKSYVNLNIIPAIIGIGGKIGNIWTVFVDYVVPTRAAMWRLILIGIIIGVGPLGYLLYMKGFLGFIKLGRRQADEISGVTQVSVIEHSTPTPPPRPPVEEEQT